MKRYRRVMLAGALCLAAGLLALHGCALLRGGETRKKGLQEFANESGAGVFYRQANMPPAVLKWVENAALNLFLGQSRVFGDYRYILVTYGPKPTGGYAVKVTDVVVGPDVIAVTVDFKDPLPGENVTEAYSYPYDLVLVPAVDLPVEFTGRGAQEYVMTLGGIESLLSIVASSTGIKVFEPAPGAVLTGTVRFSGVASVFEGQIDYRLLTGEQEVLTEGYTMAGMGDWYYFLEEIPIDSFLFSGTAPGQCVLELFTISPKDGSETDKVSIAITLRR